MTTTDAAIRVLNLGKMYRIGQGARAGYQTLRDQLAGALLAPLNALRARSRSSRNSQSTDSGGGVETIWALKDVTFDVQPGEVVGIIGRNGAGKSTLLKILTRITEPTLGSVDMVGRVGSLLEVGTGFHKELTGRENVYLNGAILGMRKAEIDRKFDEIVAFSEIEKFIDTPVKFYSSGMQVRLAFAVAAHLEPEVLLVDEVLAVGDAAFQKKCLNKMEDVGKKGRTVLFVSHHMPSITRLCERAIWLDQGRLVMDGPAIEVVGEYLKTGLETTSYREWPTLAEAPGNDIVRLRAVRVKSQDGQVNDTFDIRQPVGIEMEFEVLTPGVVLYPHFTVHNDEGLWLFVSIDNDPAWRRCPRPAGRYISTGWIPGNFLTEGMFSIGAAMRTEEPYTLHFHEHDVVAFHIVESPEKDAARVDHPGRFPGVVRPYLKWETKYIPR